jgi:hypothetical protein
VRGKKLAWAGAVPLLRTATALIVAVLASTILVSQPRPQPPGDIFSGTNSLEMRLEAPFHDLFAKGANDESYVVRGSMTVRDPRTGASAAIQDLEVSVRGHTSRGESECTFPKLKLKLPKHGTDAALFAGIEEVKIGTHCGDTPGEALTQKFGRLANEMSPLREALAYRMLAAVGVPTLRARSAHITYVDPTGPPVTRAAMILEGDGEARKRLGGTSEVPLEAFGDVRTRHAVADAARIAFGEALIGNFDWCLKFSPDDAYRCDERKPLWNVVAYERANGGTTLVVKDLDIAGVVVGRHPWFNTVFNPAFLPSKSPAEIEVVSQVQRTRSLFTREQLDGTRRALTTGKVAMMAAIASADVDPHGRDIARAYATAFFNAITEDAAFYRPVVVKPNVRMYMDDARKAEACGAGDAMTIGTPVNEVKRSGLMSQVIVLDVYWRWAPPRQCRNVQAGPVWIESGAISANYPKE